MQHSGFMVYQASAGSGKTFQLALRFLTLCLQSGEKRPYQSILAITFSKKAAREMKDRVTRTLEDISNNSCSGTSAHLKAALLDATGLSEHELQRKSRRLLINLLHDYSRFSMMTIDSFTQRMVRSFAHDLDLPLGFEVELQDAVVLEEAADRVIARAETDPELDEILTKYAAYTYQESKSIQLKKDLVSLGEDLINEQSAELLRRIAETELDLGAIRNAEKKIEAYKATISSAIKSMESFIQAHGLEKGDFHRKGMIQNTIRSIPTEKNWGLGVKLTYLKEFNKATYIDKTHPNYEELNSGFYQVVEPIYTSWMAHGKEVFEASILVEQQFKFMLVKRISEAVQEVFDETGTVHISAFNRILADQIKDQPAPFIYERIGERYLHYFIDEFQDTSKVQWNNLKPLVENGLANAGSVFLVGDSKQSIYSWRGGNAAQFLELGNPEKPKYPLLDRDHEKRLIHLDPAFENCNYRSRANIIRFNNDLYETLSAKLSSREEQLAFETAFQNPNSAESGYIEIQVLPKPSKGEADEGLQFVLDSINKVLEEGYKPGDIAILVRGHKVGSTIANHLVENGLQVVSADSLRLLEDPDVMRVTAVLEWVSNPSAPPKQLAAFQAARETGILEEDTRLNTGVLSQAQTLLEERFPVEQWRKTALLPLVQSVVSRLYPEGHYHVFLSALLDQALAFARREEDDVQSFLDHLAEVNSSVELPEDTNSIQLLTTHKSKGLEFPVVILPLSKTEVINNHHGFWVPSPDGFPVPSAYLKPKDIESLPEHWAPMIQEKVDAARLEAMNLLYVGTTRAVDCLFIGAIQKGKSGKTECVDDWIIEFLGGATEWSKGEIPKPKPRPDLEKEVPKDRVIPTGDWLNRIAISKTYEKMFKGARGYGNLVHTCLEEILYAEDLDQAVRKMEASGAIKAEEKAALREQVEAIISHPELAPFYSRRARVYNERSFVSEEGKLLRPDRVVALDGEWVVMDYKTGLIRESHETQIKSYMTGLAKTSSDSIRGILIYLNSNEIDIRTYEN